MEQTKLTQEHLMLALSEIMKENPIPKFHPSVEREVERYITEHISDFYSMDYSTMTSYVNVDKLKETLNDYLSQQTITNNGGN